MQEAGGDTARQAERAFELAFTRQPNDTERSAALRFLETQTAIREIGKRAPLHVIHREIVLAIAFTGLVNANNIRKLQIGSGFYRFRLSEY
jgi:hypothetical protein